MEGHSPEAALARIYAALDRIEGAAASARPAGDAELAARHDHLRNAVAESLTAMDALIAGAQP
jgi:hypothetical protein